MQTETSMTYPARPPRIGPSGAGETGSNAPSRGVFPDDFTGLEERADRYAILTTIKRLGKQAGFTPRLVALLDYFVAFTTDLDWEEGARPVVFCSVSRIAMDLGVSERQVQYMEKQLHELGALCWNDSGNCRRFGRRDPETGRLLFAYGVDLSPLAALQPYLEAKLHEKQLRDQAWREAKRQVSWHRRQIRALLSGVEEGDVSDRLAAFTKAYDKIAIEVRAHFSLERVRGLLREHQELHEALAQLLDRRHEKRRGATRSSANPSRLHDKNFVPIKTTNQSPSDESDTKIPKWNDRVGGGAENPAPRHRHAAHAQRSGGGRAGDGDPILATGLQHVTLKQALGASSRRIHDRLPVGQGARGWGDLVEASYRLSRDLGIGQRAWADACAALTRNGAAVCVLLVDRAMQRESNPVRSAPAYFRALIQRARGGELRLHRSVLALSKPEPRGVAA